MNSEVSVTAQDVIVNVMAYDDEGNYNQLFFDSIALRVTFWKL